MQLLIRAFPLPPHGVTGGLVAGSSAFILGYAVWVFYEREALFVFRTCVWMFVFLVFFVLATGVAHGLEGLTQRVPSVPSSASWVELGCAAASLVAVALAGTALSLRRISRKEWAAESRSLAQQRDSALSALAEARQEIQRGEDAAQRNTSTCKRLTEALECTSDIVVSLDHEWTFVYGNRRAQEKLATFRMGGNLWQCFPSLLGTAGEEELRRAMTEHTTTQWEDFCPHDRLYNARAFPTDEGLSVFFTDITDERSVREQLQDEQRARERRIEALSLMAGGLAHEISNPLAIIHARASDLRDSLSVPALTVQEVSAAEVREVCETIVSTSDRAMRILRWLRNFGREAGQDPMDWASIDDIVEECLELQAPRYERREVQLTAEIEAEMPPLCCRETQIGQVVTNLLNNALDAIDGGQCTERWVRLTARRMEDEMWLEVADSGPGVEEQFRAKLMEPFFTTKKGGAGMGVGLSLSRSIAEEHGGSLALVAGGEPTRFRLCLPLSGEDAGTGPENEMGR